MPRFVVDLRASLPVFGTATVEADTEAEARRLARALARERPGAVGWALANGDGLAARSPVAPLRPVVVEVGEDPAP